MVFPCQQYIYVSTPSDTPISVTIKQIGGINETNDNVSNLTMDLLHRHWR